jgi:hypothetical protein
LRNPFRDPVAVAGWLFADFLLAAAIIFLATSPGATAPPPPTLPPGVPTPTPVPTATPLPCNNTVVLRKIELNLAAGPGGGDPTDQQLPQVFEPYRAQQAGIILTFGHNPSIPSAIGEATRVNERLRRLFPTLVPSTTILENYYSGEGQAGSVNFIMYLQNNSCAETPSAPPPPGAPAPGAPLPPGPVQTPGTGPAGLIATPVPAQGQPTPVLPLLQPVVPAPGR